MQFSINSISGDGNAVGVTATEFRVSAMAVDFTEESQNAHSAVVLFPDGGTIDPQYESGLPLGLVEVPDPLKKELCLNSEMNLLIRTCVMMDRVDSCASCNLNVDIEKGMAKVPKSNEESTGCSKSDDSLVRDLQNVVWLQLTGIFMQLFMHQSSDLTKVASKEKTYDTPAIRSRKFKRSPSFNSRRVLLLFSVVSSMGTIVLIYLTLRVRQIGDGFSNS